MSVTRIKGATTQDSRTAAFLNVLVDAEGRVITTTTPSAVEVATPLQAKMTVTGASQPTALSSTPLLCRRATVLGLKDWRVSNVGNAWLGTSSTAGHPPMLLPPNGEIDLVPPAGACLDLSQWFLEAANALDGCVILYQV